MKMLSDLIPRVLQQCSELTNKKSNEIRYKNIPSSRYNEVLEHLKKEYCPDEPLSQAAKVSSPVMNPDLEEFIIGSLNENLSVIAVNGNDQIVAVLLNGLHTRADRENMDERVEACRTESGRKIVRLLCDVNVPVDLFGQFDVDMIFDARMLSVDKLYRRHNIGLQLLSLCEVLARECGTKIIKAEPTGIYSQKILKSLGYETFNEIIYDEYLNDKGEPVLKVEPPHKSVKLMCKILD